MHNLCVHKCKSGNNVSRVLDVIFRTEFVAKVLFWFSRSPPYFYNVLEKIVFEIYFTKWIHFFETYFGVLWHS